MDGQLNMYSYCYVQYWKLWLGFQKVLKHWKFYKDLVVYRQTFLDYRADGSDCAAPCFCLLLLPLVLVEVINLLRASCGKDKFWQNITDVNPWCSACVGKYKPTAYIRKNGELQTALYVSLLFQPAELQLEYLVLQSTISNTNSSSIYCPSALAKRDDWKSL